jgi:hypothetical protein
MTTFVASRVGQTFANDFAVFRVVHSICYLGILLSASVFLPYITLGYKVTNPV